MYTIVFRLENGSEIKCEALPGEDLLSLCLKNGLSVDSPCSGNGTCGKCRLRLLAGAVDMERSTHLSHEDYHDGWRLACRSRVIGDATLWVPDSARAFETDIRTADLSSEEELNRYEAESRALFETGLLPGTDAFTDYGFAVDIGTTTVTGALMQLSTGRLLAKASLGNAQIRYGADVINRILQSVKPGGREKLQHAVLQETLNPMLEKMLAEAGLTAEAISRVVIAGNTTMEHLLLGADANTIRLEPYEPEFLTHEPLRGRELALPVHPDAKIILAPNVGSYVGGDITAGVLATGLWNDEQNTLFIDLGTNGELVFGNRDFMLSCACSAGPAFEGGDISCGMRATTGAIDAVTLDPETLKPALSVLGPEGTVPQGLCGSGLISLIGELFRCGAIDAKGKFIRENPRIQTDEYGLASFVIAFPGEYSRGSSEDGSPSTNRLIELDEADIDNFIRAKAAVFSAIRALLNALDMLVSAIDRVLLAGGIGSGIDIEKAISIGMLPALPREKYRYIGNTSLTGALAMLFSDAAKDKVFALTENITYLELSTHPGYMDEFVAACFLPHTNASLFKEEN